MHSQGSPEWFQDRLGKVTASKIDDVMMKPTTAGFQNYRAQLICERLTGNPTESFCSPAMQWGTDTEPQARAFYEMETGLEVSEVGFIPHPTIDGTGASPDGLVADDGLVEFKCPNTATHIKTLLGGNIDRKYVLQMHWQMLCCERDWCDFVSFDPRLPLEMQMHRERVERDDKLAGEIQDAVNAFITEVETAVSELTERYLKEAA